MIFKFNYKRTIQFLLTLLLIPTTYIGIPLNGGDKGWIYVNSVLRDYFANRTSFLISSVHFSVFDFFVFISNILLYIAPVLVFTRLNKIGAVYIPTAFLILTLIYFPLMVILLIPYILIWVALLVYSRHTLDQ
ncbi:hypothetical protein [Pedobacter roseus]|uniref:Uncharacterized protein n=1 Tax=Pedobacter roseus TaxID=336820 RepID=A0A7G9QCM1_9SPHI|nr:hypothetical protein [Pedobacter roseus]QNN41096.1 hypothetical protein H9L23_18510 [Pedobacter roseus]